jgi:hypothetical protein
MKNQKRAKGAAIRKKIINGGQKLMRDFDERFYVKLEVLDVDNISDISSRS